MIETGIFFDTIHSYNDLNLILSKCEVSAAKPKISLVEIPGSDTPLDYSEAFGEINYSPRDCKFTFTVAPGEALGFEDKKSVISNLLSGRVFKIMLDKDPDFYYSGRVSVDDFLSDKRINQIVITSKVAPYKLKKVETVKTFALTEAPQTVEIANNRKAVVPLIECTNDNTLIKFGGQSFIVNAGVHQILDVRFTFGRNFVEISGTGSVTFKFREGSL